MEQIVLKYRIFYVFLYINSKTKIISYKKYVGSSEKYTFLKHMLQV